MSESLGTAILELDTRDTKLVAGLSAAERTTRARMSRIDRVGKTMTTHLTLPIVAAGAASIKLAMDFNQTMGQVQGLAGATKKQTDDWAQSILKLAPSLGKAPEELAKGLYFIASSGVPAAKAMDVLTVSAKASAAGLGETETIADAVTSAMNAYGPANLSAAKATDILVATVREGKGEASAIAQVIGQLLPLASELGVGFEEVGGSMAQMTRLGMPAAEAGTALQAVMSGLLKPSVDSNKALKEVGLSAGGLRKQLADKGVLSVLDTLNEKFDGNTDAIARVFPNIRALRGALALAGKAGKNTKDVFAGVADSTGALNHAFAVASEESEFKFQQAMASVKATGIAIGNSLMPTFLRLMGAVRDLAMWWQTLSPGMQNFILIAAGVLAAVGPLVRVCVALATAIRGIALACTFLAANPAVLLLAAFVALAVGLVILYRRSETFRNAVRTLGNALKTALYAVASAAMAFKNALVTAFNAVLNWLKDNWRTIVTIIAGPFAPLVALATNAFGIRSALIAAFQAVLGAVRGAIGAIVGAIRTAAGTVAGLARRIGTGIYNGVRNGVVKLASLGGQMLAHLATAIGQVAGWVVGIAASIGSRIVDGVISGMSSLAGAVKSKAESMLKSALSSLNPFSPVEHGGEIYIGKPIMDGAVKGIQKNQGKVKKALSQAVKDAITQAKQNLTTLAGSISQTLGDAIDRGTNNKLLALDNSPEAQRIKALDKQLDEESAIRQRASLQDAITNAETDKDRQEAQDALRTYDLEQEKTKLEQQLSDRRDAIQTEADMRKQALNQGITDLTDALNRGLISQAEYTSQLNALIAAQAPEYQNLGALLGESAARGYIDTWNALLSQSGLVNFGGIGGGGQDISVISPEGVANQEAAKAAREAAAKKKAAQKKKLEAQLAAMRDAANNPGSPGGATITPAERQEIENMMKRIRGLATGGIIKGALGRDKAGVFALSNGEGVIRPRAMENMMQWWEKGGGGGQAAPQINFNGPVVGAGDTRTLARELAALIQPELNRRVALTT